MVFTKKYKEITSPRIVTDLAVEFTPFVAGKSKSKIAPKMQKSQSANGRTEIPAIISNQPNSVIRYHLGCLSGIIALAFCYNAKSSLVLGWR